jgi:hypothetical protein
LPRLEAELEVRRRFAPPAFGCFGLRKLVERALQFYNMKQFIVLSLSGCESTASDFGALSFDQSRILLHESQQI